MTSQNNDFSDLVLEKSGQFADLVFDKHEPVEEIEVVLTWNVSRAESDFDADLIIPQLVPLGYSEKGDVVRTLLGRTGKNISYHGNFVTADKAITLDQDDRTGERGERAFISLGLVGSPAVDEIPVIATIADATAKGGQTWANVEGVLTLFNKRSGKKICHFNLADKFPNDDTVMIGSFMRTTAQNGQPAQNDWRFIVTAHGFNSGAGGVMRALQAMWSVVPARPL